MENRVSKRGRIGEGRPPRFKSVEELSDLIDKYFEDCDNTIVRTIYGKDGDVMETITTPYTISGLCRAIDVTRDTLITYGEKDQYFDTIRQAKSKVMEQQELRALSGQANPTFSIFSFKNNHGWVDKTEQTIDQKITYADIDDMPEDIELNKLLKPKDKSE